jgi:hypothetical protein
MNFVVKNPGPWGGLGTHYEGSMFFGRTAKIRPQDEGTGQRNRDKNSHPMALTGLDNLAEIYPR